MHTARTLVAAAYIVQAVAIFICTCLIPSYLFRADQGGISNFGTQAATVIPYSLAFIGGGLLLIAAGTKVNIKSAHSMGARTALLVVGALNIAVAITTYTYKLSSELALLHQYSALALFLAELPIAVWFAFSASGSATTRRWFVVFASGFGLAALTYFGLLHVLFVAEAVTAAGFALVCVSTLSTLERNLRS